MSDALALELMNLIRCDNVELTDDGVDIYLHGCVIRVRAVTRSGDDGRYPALNVWIDEEEELPEDDFNELMMSLGADLACESSRED